MKGSRILSNISRTKHLDSSDLQTNFERCLTTTDLTLLGIGTMVGSGVYVLTGEVAKNLAGPAVIISYIIAGLVSLTAAICYAEFGGRVPKTGSAFMYAYVTVGELWAFLIGWNLILEYTIAAAATATAWSGCVNQLFGNEIENLTIRFILNGTPWESDIFPRYPNFVGFGVVCVCMLVVCIGVSCSSRTMNFFVALNVFIVSVVFILSLTKADISNLTTGDGFFAFGFHGVISGSATCFFAFGGFDAIALAAEEAITPGKSIPIASVASVLFTMCLYVLASLALILLVPYYEIVPQSAFPMAFKTVGYKWAEVLVAVGNLIGMGSAIIGAIFASARSVYAMATEGLLFPCFSVINKHTQVPMVSIIVFGTLSAIIALLFELSALVEFLSIGTLMAYGMVSASVIIIRYKPTRFKQDYSYTDVGDPIDAYNSTVSSHENCGGTLKDQFKRFPVISNFPPGRAVSICYFISLIFQVLIIVVVLQVPNISSKWWAIYLAITFGCIALLTFVPILMHHQNQDILTFKAPFVPYLPALSVFCNILLMVRLKPLTWIRFLVWLTIGLAIYVFYGYDHSQEGIKRRAECEIEDEKILSANNSMHYGSIELHQSTSDAMH